MTTREASVLRRRLREHDADMLRQWRGDGRQGDPPERAAMASKTTLSIRVGYDTLAVLDMLAEHSGVLPTALARDFIHEGIARASSPDQPLAQLDLAIRLLSQARERLAPNG